MRAAEKSSNSKREHIMSCEWFDDLEAGEGYRDDTSIKQVKRESWRDENLGNLVER